MSRSAAARWHYGYLFVAFGFTLVALAARILLALHLSSCGTPDACAYFGLAQSLAAHEGFRQNFLVQYLGAPPVAYAHGVEYWRPGTSFLLLLGRLGGPLTLHGATIVSVAEGVGIAAVAALLAWRNSRDPMTVSFAYIVCLLSPAVWVGSGTPDSSMPDGLFIALFLLLFRVEGATIVQDVLALLAVSAVDLIRNDSILLLVPLVAVLATRHLRARGTHPVVRVNTLPYAVLMAVLFFAAMLPMHLIDKAVLGRAFPPAPASALLFTEMGDLITYGKPLSAHALLAGGAGHFILVRLAATVTIVYRQILLLAGFGCLFLPALLLERRWRRPRTVDLLLGGSVLYVVIILVYGLVLPVVGVMSALRTFQGLVPLFSVAVVLGVVAAIPQRRIARAVLAGLSCFYLIYGISAARAQNESLNAQAGQRREFAAFLQQQGIEPGRSLLMIADPAQFAVDAHYPSIPVPPNGAEAIFAAARQYRPNAVVLGEEYIPGGEDAIRRGLGATRVVADHAMHLVVFMLDRPRGVSEPAAGRP